MHSAPVVKDEYERGIMGLVGSAFACPAAWVLLWFVLQCVPRRRAGGRGGRLLNGMGAEDLDGIPSVQLTGCVLIK